MAKARIDVNNIRWHMFNGEWNEHYNPVAQANLDSSIRNNDNMQKALKLIKELEETRVQNHFSWIVEEGAKIGWGCDQAELGSFFSEIAGKFNLEFNHNTYNKRLQYHAELELPPEERSEERSEV